MNYIKKIVIENFQSHQYSEIELTPGLNVVVGPSDHGKSAIIRAIKWVLFNEPKGNEFIKHGANYCKVMIEISNGYKIIREKSPTKNRYTVINLDGETNIYEGFGHEVPDEVKKAHGIVKVVMDIDKDICLNIGEQLESPFLISETGVAKAKAVGRLTGVHIIDRAIRETLADIKRESQIEYKCKKEIEELNNKLKMYENLDELREKIEKREEVLKKIEENMQKLKELQNKKLIIEQIDKEINKNSELLKRLTAVNQSEILILKASEKIMRLSKLDSLRHNLDFITVEIQMLNKTLKRTQDIPNASEKLQKIMNILNKLNCLNNLNQKQKEIDKNILRANLILENYKNIQFAEKIIEKLSELVIKKEKLKNLNSLYKSLQNDITDTIKFLNNVMVQINTMLKKYEEKLRNISKCPICFQPIDDNLISKIIIQYKEEL